MNRYFVYLIVIILEFFIIYFYFTFDRFKLESYKKEMIENALHNIEYSLSKGYLKVMFMAVRDFISWGGKIEDLRKYKEQIEKVLKDNFLTADAYYLSKALVDEQNRPFYLKNAKLSNDTYISNISKVYYYILVSKEITEAFGGSYDQWKKNIPSEYKWLIDLLDKPIFSFAKEFVINKLKDAAMNSRDYLLSSICLALLISIDYKDEKFYNSFLGSSVPVVFITSTVGLYITGKSVGLKEYEKYNYFVLNKPDLYRYYSILLICKYSQADIYLMVLNFDILKDYKDCTISIVSLLN